MSRLPYVTTTIAIAALLAVVWHLGARIEQLEARPCIVASAASESPRNDAAPETPAARRARLERQARELVRWDEEYRFLMRHARTAARDPETPPR